MIIAAIVLAVQVVLRLVVTMLAVTMVPLEPGELAIEEVIRERSLS